MALRAFFYPVPTMSGFSIEEATDLDEIRVMFREYVDFLGFPLDFQVCEQAALVRRR
jgi:hypothetical protein